MSAWLYPMSGNFFHWARDAKSGVTTQEGRGSAPCGRLFPFPLRATPHNCGKKKASSEENATIKTYRSILFAGRTESSLNRKPVGQIQIRQCEHDIQFCSLFSQPSISCFAISEQSFYNGKYMLNFAAYR